MHRPFPISERLYKMGYRHARRVVITIVGFSVLAVGLAMVVLPGPAVLVIPLGLLILSAEFIWARRLLRRMKKAMNGNGVGKQGNGNQPNKSQVNGKQVDEKNNSAYMNNKSRSADNISLSVAHAGTIPKSAGAETLRKQARKNGQ